jgi:hypothetical protein
MTTTTVLQALRAREQELDHVMAELAALDGPVDPKPLTVIPS